MSRGYHWWLYRRPVVRININGTRYWLSERDVVGLASGRSAGLVRMLTREQGWSAQAWTVEAKFL